MANRKMVIVQNIPDELAQKVRTIIPNWDIIVGKEKELWQSHLTEAEIIVGFQSSMTDIIINSETNIKWIQSWSAGVNSYPLEELAHRNILLTSANGVHAFPISETVFGLILALTRKIHTYVKQQERKEWYHAHLNAEIHNKTIGIIGVGAIGKEVAKIAKAFGMHVIGVRNSDQQEENIDHMVTSEKLNDILPQCDFVVVTVPLTHKTYHMFGAEQFQKMKASSLLINIGRGAVIDEPALIDALKKEEIAGAGLDVFEKEPLDEESSLWDMDQVIVTPHTSGSTEFYDKRVVEDLFIPNLKSYLNGKRPPFNLVDYKKGY